MKSHSPTKPKRKPKAKDVNPIEGAIRSWAALLPEEFDIDGLVNAAPRRWVVYPPMALLPSGSFGKEKCHLLESHHRDALWREILRRIGEREGKGALTHLAINSGIPAAKSEAIGENILRTPSGLVMLYGDFGPGLSPDQAPTARDFERAFWVSTKQNGMTQVWAPRYTMFSRGNVKEKARLLDFHSSHRGFENRRARRDDLRKEVAVDLYAGIGYFVFSYVKMGMGRSLGWELNPWSVEGLRRGAVANGWDVKIVGADEEWEEGSEEIAIFLEDNQKAMKRMSVTERDTSGRVSHVNCGLLPTSEGSWKIALEIVQGNAWLHLHENVGVKDVDHRKSEIESLFRVWLNEKKDERQIKVEHVEFVKTFAPGVWHCVFDIYISSL